MLLYGEDVEIYSLREKFSFFDKFTGLWYRNGIHVAWERPEDKGRVWSWQKFRNSQLQVRSKRL